MKTISDSLKENNLNSPYLNYASNTFSQFGDDGIINQLLKELNKCGNNKQNFTTTTDR